jgi:exopolyphosphatase/guanosine-5'-triphosphate,3'-diphosphate pyrophosphatase
VVRALVSIGTNSTRLLVLDGERPLAAESRGTRIGTGIGASGALDPAARERTLAAIADYAATARRFGVGAIDAVATSALRRARDAGDFARQVERLTGVAPRILGGDEEATYSFLGATAVMAADHPVAVLDVGGGSTELAVDTPAHARAAGAVRRTLSVEVGAVRLSERHPLLLGARVPAGEEAAALEGEARADAAAVLAPFAAVRGFDELIVVGGTAFTAAAMVAGGMHDRARLSRTDCARLLARLLARDLAGRKTLAHIRPQRADILPAGLIVVDEGCRLLGVGAFTVSEADLLLGYLSSAAFRGVPLPGR